MNFRIIKSIILLTLIFIVSGCKKDEDGYKIQAILYSLETSVEDPGIECELYGNIWSYIDNGSRVDAHDHFQHTEDSYFETGLHEVYIFAETPVSVKTWKGITDQDVIIIRIKLFEDDLDLVDEDDSFGDKIFTVPVSDIISEIDQGSSFYEKSGLTVYCGTEWISITFRFRIID